MPDSTQWRYVSFGCINIRCVKILHPVKSCNSLDLQLRRSPVRAIEYNPPAAKQAKKEPPTNITPFGALESFQYYDPPQALSAGKVSTNHTDTNLILWNFSLLTCQDLDCLLLCSHELVLPDLSTMHTRMLLGAWEEGLEGVNEEAAELMMLALQVQSIVTDYHV